MRGKVPAAEYLPESKWKPLRERPLTMDQAFAIFRHGEGLGFATITGAASRVAVIDVDPRNGGTLEGLELPDTPTARTPQGGAHLYFAIPEGITLRSVDLRSGVELLAEGKYCVTAPSAGYEWHEGKSPDDLPLAPLPTWVLETARASGAMAAEACETPVNEGGTSSKYSLLVPGDDPPLSTDNMADCSSASRSPAGASNARGTSRVARRGAVPIAPLQGDALRAWDADENFARAAAALLGIPDVPIGKAFRCILPGHTDEHPSASLYRDRSGAVVYRDWHRADGEEWYTLAEVRASLAYGKAVKLSGPELATWHLRLLVETGFVEPAQVQAKELPDDAPAAARSVYEGFLLLLGCKWLHTPDEPTTFSWRFAAAWCGDMSKSTAERGMTWLLQHGYIRKVGEVTAGYGRKMALFLPGSAAHVERRQKRKDKPSARKTRTKGQDEIEERLSKARDWFEYERIWREESVRRRPPPHAPPKKTRAGVMECADT